MTNEAWEQVLDVGLLLWTKTHGSGGGDREAMQAAEETAVEINGAVNGASFVVMDMSRLWFAVQWIHAGRVTITAGHRFAAALCASNVRDLTLLEELRLPADAFRIEVPSGLLHSDEPLMDIEHISVVFSDTSQTMLMLEGLGRVNPEDGRRGPVCITVNHNQQSGTFSKRVSLFGDIDDNETTMLELPPPVGVVPLAQRDKDLRMRMLAMAKRLVVGLLFTMQSTTDWKDQVRPLKVDRHNKRNGPPTHRFIFVGRPLSVDCRPAIAAYIGGTRKGSVPQVQVLVKGHHKRQAHGVGRVDRKIIWIEPYWRGPEDAPIIARTRVVAEKENVDG